MVTVGKKMISTNLQVPYKIAPRREGDVDAVYSDASLAKKELGWTAARGLDEMCKQ